MTLLGVDVSGWNPGIDFNPLPADFAIVKLTGGNGFANAYAGDQLANARAAGTRRGAYHFAHEIGCQAGPEAEADWFLQRGHDLGCWDGTTLPVLDWESDNQADTGWALTFLRRVRDNLGVRPWLYLNGSNVRAYDWSAAAAEGFRIWYAQYAVTTPTFNYYTYDGVTPAAALPAPVLPWGLQTAAWQFADNMRLPGYDGGLDASVYYGSAADWDTECGGGATVQSGTITPAQELLIPELPGIYKP